MGSCVAGDGRGRSRRRGYRSSSGSRKNTRVASRVAARLFELLGNLLCYGLQVFQVATRDLFSARDPPAPEQVDAANDASVADHGYRHARHAVVDFAPVLHEITAEGRVADTVAASARFFERALHPGRIACVGIR